MQKQGRPVGPTRLMTPSFRVGSDRKTKVHVTLTINETARVSFRMDIRSSVDILPYHDYARATK